MGFAPISDRLRVYDFTIKLQAYKKGAGCHPSKEAPLPCIFLKATVMLSPSRYAQPATTCTLTTDSMAEPG